MKRVLVLVEGQTEERFIKDVVRPHLWERQIDITPTIATTKRVKQGPDFKGGITDYQKVEIDIRRLLGDTNAIAVTSFIDYYGLPTDFPGMMSRPTGNAIGRAIYIETEWRSHTGDGRFHPYLMTHEFEALLFSKPEEIGVALNNQGAQTGLALVRTSFPTPEEINENPETAPSRRILAICPGYQKALHGPMVANRIGLPVMREQCGHFSAWLDWLESL